MLFLYAMLIIKIMNITRKGERSCEKGGTQRNYPVRKEPAVKRTRRLKPNYRAIIGCSAGVVLVAAGVSGGFLLHGLLNKPQTNDADASVSEAIITEAVTAQKAPLRGERYGG